MHWWYVDGTTHFYASKDDPLKHWKLYWYQLPGSSKPSISLKRVLINIFPKGCCSLWSNPWVLLWLRCPKVSPTVRRVHFGKIVKARLLLTVTLIILLMLEIYSNLLAFRHVAYFSLSEKKIWMSHAIEIGEPFIPVFFLGHTRRRSKIPSTILTFYIYP